MRSQHSRLRAGFLVDLLPTLLGSAQIAAAVEFQFLPEDDPGQLIDGKWTGEHHGWVLF